MVLDRKGNVLTESSGQERFLRFCYRTFPGRVFLRLARAKWLTRLVGAYINSRLSAGRARRAVKKNGLDPAIYEQTEFRCFNAYFTRKRKAEAISFSTDPNVLCSPADSRMTVVPLQEQNAFPVKQAPYTVAQLLDDTEEAKRYADGWALVFRLCVDDYHRYSYPDDGVEAGYKKIPGILHTVNPIALEALPVFHRNAREVTYLESEHFGKLAFVEVGAMMVGRIVNHHKKQFVRGEEKGYFEFGGSTVVVLVEKGRFVPDADLLENSKNGIETFVRIGESVGRTSV